MRYARSMTRILGTLCALWLVAGCGAAESTNPPTVRTVAHVTATPRPTLPAPTDTVMSSPATPTAEPRSMPTAKARSTAAAPSPAQPGQPAQGEEPTPEVGEATAAAGAPSDPQAFAQALERQSPFSPPSQDTVRAAGQPGAVPLETQNPFVHLFPELRQAPAPAWLREGVRTTYYGQSATLTQSIEDTGASGAGFLHYDIVALDATTVAGSAKLYLDMGDGTVIPSLVLPSLGLPGAGEYWLHPDVLPTAERVATNELAVVHMPTEIEGRTYNAVRFQYQPAGAEYVWMFDEASGLLLFYRHTIGAEGAADRQAAQLWLVHQRQVNLPWVARGVPDWVRDGGTLTWEGRWSAEALGSPAGSFPYSIVAELKSLQPRWTQYQATDYLYDRLNGVGLRITGVSQLFDAVWLPPEALEALTDGLLDRDPVTGAEITVSRFRDGSVVLTETGTRYRTSLAYDGTYGVLQSIEQEVNSGAATILVDVQLTDWE